MIRRLFRARKDGPIQPTSAPTVTMPAEADEPSAAIIKQLRIDLGRSRVRADALQEKLSSQASTVRRAERLAGKSALRIEQLTEALSAASIEVPEVGTD